MRSFFIIVLAFLFCSRLFGQEWKWAVAKNNLDFGSTASHDYANTIGIDRESNLYILGGSKSVSGSSCTNCYSKQLLYKYSNSGEMLWRDTLPFGASKSVTDPQGKTFFIGSNLLALYNKDGGQSWIRYTTNAFFDAITLTGSSFIVAGHNLEGSQVDLGNGVMLSGNKYFFLAEFDLNGNCIWAQENGEFSPISIRLYENKIYACGDGFWADNSFVNHIAVYSRNGKIESSIGPALQGVRSVDFDISPDGTIYFVGQYTSLSPLDLEGVRYDCECKTSSFFVVKYSLDGQRIWSKVFQGDSGCSDLEIDYSGNVYLSGLYSQNIKTDHFSAETSYREMFLMKFSEEGNMNFFVESDCDSLYDRIGINDFLVKSNGVYFAGSFTYTPKLGSIQLTERSMYSDMVIGMLQQDLTMVNEPSTFEPFLKVYPNPSNGWIKVRLNEEMNNGTLKVQDVLGRIVFSQKISSPDFIVNIENASDGLFFVVAEKEGTVLVQKVLVNH